MGAEPEPEPEPEEVKEEVKPTPETPTPAPEKPVEVIIESQVPVEQMVTIPKKQYDELVAVNDTVFIALMTAYDKFDDMMGAVMNLNTLIFNKKKELKILITELNKPTPTKEQDSSHR